MIRTAAPAKIILVGEHAVVYGQPAIAIPVHGLKVIAEGDVTEVHGLHIKALDTGENLRYMGTDSENPILNMVHLVLQHCGMPPPRMEIRIKSEIPIASGLGSGAAVSTALGRLLAEVLGKPLSNAELNKLVYAVEGLHHGTPSGIDNTVIVYEKPVFYIRDVDISFIEIGQPVHLLIADTGQQALTRIAVGDVRRLYTTRPDTIQPIIAAIGDLSRRASAALSSGDIHTLGCIMSDNHRLLQQLTVSSVELDKLVEIAMGAGALGAKLSGGGRGGNMIALVTPETIDSVRSALLQAGAVAVYETIVE